MTFKYAYGITSKTQDNSHIYMGDIDNKMRDSDLAELCEDIQKKCRLSDIIIIKSTNGYNLVSLDKLPLKLIFLINKEYAQIDPLYNYLQTYRRGFYTLRTLPNKDKHFFGIIKNDGIFRKSNAHRMFFNNFFGFTKKDKHYIFFDDSFDSYEEVMIIRFMNVKYGWDQE